MHDLLDDVPLRCIITLSRPFSSKLQISPGLFRVQKPSAILHTCIQPHITREGSQRRTLLPPFFPSFPLPLILSSVLVSSLLLSRSSSRAYSPVRWAQPAWRAARPSPVSMVCAWCARFVCSSGRTLSTLLGIHGIIVLSHHNSQSVCTEGYTS